jgi:hypothetical protein
MKTMSSILQKIAIVVLAVFLLHSCKKNDSGAPQDTNPAVTDTGNPVGDLTSASIGPSGGTLQSADGNISVTIPAGALSSTTSISIQPVTNNAPLGLGFGYRLQPEGTTFAKPVQLTFHYDQTVLKKTLPDFLWIVTQAANGSWNAMLKSIVDTSAKTVTISSTHFSDWALGRFIDFTLNPVSTAIKKGQSVKLSLTGFSRDKAIENDELVPLIPMTGQGDDLTPITPIQSQLMDFRVKQWTMNGTAAPVSNGNGSLTASGVGATYTAPNQKPTVNPVAVSVEVEASNKAGTKAKFLITSTIMVETDYYLSLKIDGKPIEYTQYGFTTTTPPDPDNFSMVSSGLTGGRFEIVASYISTLGGPKNTFNIAFDNASVSTRSLISSNSNGNDVLEFIPDLETSYNINYWIRGLNSDKICNRQALVGSVSEILTSLTGSNPLFPNFTEVRGSFSGKVYDDKKDFDNQCKSSEMHTIEGEFWLMSSVQ